MCDPGADCVVEATLPSGKVLTATVVVAPQTTADKVVEALVQKNLSDKNPTDFALARRDASGKEKVFNGPEILSRQDLERTNSLRLLHVGQATVVMPRHSSRHHPPFAIVTNPDEACVTNIEMRVIFPNGKEQLRQLWMLHDPSSDMKKHLLQAEGFDQPPYTPYENMVMELHFEDKYPLTMKDDTTLSFYLKDMSAAQYLIIRHKNPLS